MAVACAESEIESRFSEALKRARDGETVVIVRDGEPFAEPRPIKRGKRDDGKAAPANQTIEERLAETRRDGTLVPSDYPKRPLRLGKPSPGALQRFLAERWGVDKEDVEKIRRGE